MRMAKIAMHVFCCVAALAVMVPSAHAYGVEVGSSTLIDPAYIDYSDTFSITGEPGALPDRPDGAWPVGSVDDPVNGIVGEGLKVENCYGNPQQWWDNGRWAIATDASASSGATTYPGGSGAGSATGMTQTGNWVGEWGIEYGLRDEFVVQFDGVSTEDRVGITFGGVRNDLWHPSNLSVFVRLSGSAVWPSIALLTTGVPSGIEVDTGLISPIDNEEEWHNYAFRVDILDREIQIFIDEASVGIVDLDTVGLGVLAALPLSSHAVSVNWAHPYADPLIADRFWSDNFQIGLPKVEEPPQIPGDANNDGDVDAIDAQRLAAFWGATEEDEEYSWWEMGDFDGDEYVGPADAAIMAANWGYSASEANSAVPEPSVALMLLTTLGAWLVWRRR